MTATVFDARVCALGEGALWHPQRQQLFWFDIIEQKLMTQEESGQVEWTFDEPVSAAGWVSDTELLIASATGLWRFDLGDGSRTILCPLEAKNSVTRSNDGRADPWGGFWIGTMGRQAQPEAGAIYRYYQGTLKTLFTDISISNAICFAPDRSVAYYTDTSTSRIMSVALDRNGWPAGTPQVFVDLMPHGLNPDGAVTDASGTLWVALWGASKVAAFDRNGAAAGDVAIPASQVTCPAFGGPDFETLFVTSAASGLSAGETAYPSEHGKVFASAGVARGLPEPRVLL